MHVSQRTYSIHSTASSLLMLSLSWKKIFYLLIYVVHHHYVVDDVIIKTIAFSAVSQNELHLHKNIFCYQLLNDIIKLILPYSNILRLILYLSHKKLQIIIKSIY